MSAVFYRLFCFGSANRAFACACTSFDAFIGIDNVFAVTFKNCFYGASICASAAHDASIGNFVCQTQEPPSIMDILILSHILKKSIAEKCYICKKINGKVFPFRLIFLFSLPAGQRQQDSHRNRFRNRCILQD